jgi:hypothetical protein
MQALVRCGCGLALIREGTPLDPEFTTRPAQGVDLTVTTAFVAGPTTDPLARMLSSSLLFGGCVGNPCVTEIPRGCFVVGESERSCVVNLPGDKPEPRPQSFVPVVEDIAFSINGDTLPSADE